MDTNLKKVYLFKFLVSLHFFGGVLIPFFTLWGRVSFTQIMLLQSIFMLSILVLEVPTGAVADYLGRKYSLALGALFIALGAVLYSIWRDFTGFAVAEVAWAAGGALFSGADEAYVYDTLKRLRKVSTSKEVLGRFGAIGIVGILVAAPLGSLMADLVSVRFTMIAFIPCSVLAAVVAMTLQEPPRDSGPRTRYRELVKKGFIQIRQSRALQLLTLDRVILAALLMFVIWLYQPLLEQLGVPIIYFGLFHAALAAVQIPVMRSYGTMERWFGGRRRYVVASAAIPGLCLLAMGWVSSIVAVTFFLLVTAALGLTRTALLSNYINKHVESDNRATVLSVVSMAQRVAFAVLYPVVGLVVDYSLRMGFILVGALAIASALLSPVREEHLLD